MNAEIKERIEKVRRSGVPEGYQKTKGIGIAPISWKIGHLNDVIHNVQRPVPKPSESYWRLGLRSHAKGTFHELVENPDTVSMEELYEVKANDLIVNITFAWEHAIALADGADDGLLVSHRFPTYVFKLGNSPQYYKAIVTQKGFKELLGNISPGGAGRNRVMSKPNFLKLPCYIPPTAEQNKIAEILIGCDKVIELKKQLLQEKRKQKQWLMQNLLNPNSGVRLPNFEGEWNKSTIKDLFTFGSSISASRQQLGSSGICYLHYGDIHRNTTYLIDTQRDYAILPKLTIDNIPEKTILKDGDIVFVDASEDYEGASKYVVIKNEQNIPFISGLHTLPVKSKDKRLTLDFKRYCFQSYDIKRQIAFYVSGMKVYGLSKSNISKIIVSYPNRQEQTAIAKILSATDHEIDLLEQECKQWQKKKKALMQLLLTGIVRVHL